MERMRFASLALIILAICGCALRSRTMRIVSYGDGASPKPSLMDDWLSVQGIVRKDAATLQIMIRAENKRMAAAEFEYRFLWFDADGFPVKSVTSEWKAFTLDADDRMEFTGVEPTAQVTDYRFEVRYPDAVYGAIQAERSK